MTPRSAKFKNLQEQPKRVFTASLQEDLAMLWPDFLSADLPPTFLLEAHQGPESKAHLSLNLRFQSLLETIHSLKAGKRSYL